MTGVGLGPKHVSGEGVADCTNLAANYSRSLASLTSRGLASEGAGTELTVMISTD